MFANETIRRPNENPAAPAVPSLHPRCHLNPREYPLRIAEGGHRKATVTVSLLQRDNSFCCCTLGVSGPYNHSKFMIKHLGIVTENECKKK